MWRDELDVATLAYRIILMLCLIMGWFFLAVYGGGGRQMLELCKHRILESDGWQLKRFASGMRRVVTAVLGAPILDGQLLRQLRQGLVHTLAGAER